MDYENIATFMVLTNIKKPGNSLQVN
ncbi:uncharacterized protein METZ01_LOCUS331226 [marine metagenome]|uniref:Uncharacterized protein n=1 Tax=marine metagenome TaxID=408172 RepID=A0A382Q1V2_9ZZZZ